MSATAQLHETQAPEDLPISLGIIGDRQLLCVQTFDIARHPSAAVGLIPGCFVAVSGKGPTDSNESGKTSWLAAVSLLLGDPEWRMHSSGPASVADLLFEPQTAGIGAHGCAPATTGYIAGLFADPGQRPRHRPHRVAEALRHPDLRRGPAHPGNPTGHRAGRHRTSRPGRRDLPGTADHVRARSHPVRDGPVRTGAPLPCLPDLPG